MKQQFYTKEELEQIFEESKYASVAEVAKKHKRSTAGVYVALSNIKRAKQGIITPGNESIARILGITSVVKKQEEGKKTDGISRLQDAFTRLQEEIANVVAEEVHKRTEKAITEKTNELEEEKKVHHTESEKLRLIIKELQEASLTSVLKRKLMQ